MKTLTKRKPGAGKPRRNGSVPPAVSDAAIRDGTGAWSAGLWNDAHAVLVGRMAGLMPQIDELMGDLTARLLGDAGGPGRTIFRGLAGDAQRMQVLHALRADGPRGGKGEEIGAALARYAAARRRWRACVNGLWYTHDNGRTFLAAPGGVDAATFLVAREVKTVDLEADLARLTELGATLPRLAQAQGKARASASAPRAVPTNRQPETARKGRAAARGEAGTRRRRTGQGDFAD